MNPIKQTPEQSLCISCGFCCDGTLFDYAPIEPEDEISPLLAAGNIINKQKTGDSFNMPCAAHLNGCCQIYNQSRPVICHNYSCLLLEKHSNGNISFEEAEKNINRVHELKESLKQEIADIVPESRNMSIPELKKLLPETEAMLADPVLLKTWGKAMMTFTLLRAQLKTHFQPPNPEDSQGEQKERMGNFNSPNK